jgi:hypothetical protein
MPKKIEKTQFNVPLQIVVAFRSLENCRHVATILVNLGLDPICISSVAQCRELLAKEDIDVIFWPRRGGRSRDGSIGTGP